MFGIFVSNAKIMQKIVRIILVVCTCVAVGYLSGEVTKDSVGSWYPTLEKPFFNPPNWLFAPVWTILYIMMGVAGGMVWNHIETQPKEVKKAFLFFVIQLALNALWSYLFFGLRNPLLALIEIIVLWLMVYETYVVFKPINKTAAWLLLPYLAWVAFATLLNASIWWLNS